MFQHKTSPAGGDGRSAPSENNECTSPSGVLTCTTAQRLPYTRSWRCAVLNYNIALGVPPSVAFGGLPSVYVSAGLSKSLFLYPLSTWIDGLTSPHGSIGASDRP